MAVKRFYFFGSYSSFKPFIMEVESDSSGEFTIPTTGSGYNYNVRTSDGQTFTGQTGNLTITFPSPNTRYDVEISGLFPRIYFNNGSQRLKIKDIKQWGDVVWGANQTNAFYGCEDMECSALDLPDIEHITNAYYMFRQASDFSQEINCPNSIHLTIDTYMFAGTKIAKIILNNTAVTTTHIHSYNCPLLTDLILIDRKVSLYIAFSPLLVGSAIDDLFTSLGTANTGATITITTAQSTSGITTSIATLKGWTIVIV